MSANLNLHNEDRISVQEGDFDVALEYQRLQHLSANNGAVVFFVGLVRDFNANQLLNGLFLEHYPAMTQIALADIVRQAKEKWSLGSVTLIHRVGKLAVNEQIVMVGVTSQHRQAAFQSAEFMMDYLKVNAPFWKKELSESGDFWVEAKQTDQQAANRWSPKTS
ncbi:molybdopterin synthase catalytic subunit MoaE [Flavobacterium sp. W21_SRS_FM6]|uniref:molybdopterin synthase catalytic subunit MoaE n=1 Tax=Flavobacterium sp. W21_SRS_FM6 TaxID=3240268 RepID=UPI003F91A364